MIITSAKFVVSATRPAGYPPESLPEIAFAGRSNAGKSSVINTLVNRKKLVKTSATPGKTQLLNFFEVNHRWMFVDLPGYGYAQVPQAVKRRWRLMIETYLSSRTALRGVILIMDIRRDPGPGESDVVAWLDRRGVSVLRVLTKADKLSRAGQIRRAAAVARNASVLPGDLILFSAKTRQGEDELWQAIGRLTGEPS